MHILMATIDALEISADNLVLNRTSLQQSRENNRHYQFGEARSELIDKVIRLYLSSYYFEYVVFFCFLLLFGIK